MTPGCTIFVCKDNLGMFVNLTQGPKKNKKVKHPLLTHYKMATRWSLVSFQVVINL